MEGVMQRSSGCPGYQAVLLSLLLVCRTDTFLLPWLSVKRAPHVTSSNAACFTGLTSSRRYAAVDSTAEETAGTAVVEAAEVWEGFEEKDHDRFLAEFWQKKPLLIRQALKG